MNGSSRKAEMLDKYGECCTKVTAAHILGVTRRAIYNMIEDGRLSIVCSGSMVDVRSICDYIEKPAAEKKRKHREHATTGMEIIL